MNGRYMKELGNLHSSVLKEKNNSDTLAPRWEGRFWKLMVILEHLITALMEKERNPQDVAIEKVLIHSEPSTEVHLVRGDFLDATETVCGERLHSICCVHITNDNIPVTCAKCANTGNKKSGWVTKRLTALETLHTLTGS